MRTARHRSNATQTMQLIGNEWVWDGDHKMTWPIKDGENHIKNGFWIETTEDTDDTPGNHDVLNPVQTAIGEACITLQAMLINKNRDYGDSVFNAPVMAPQLDPGLAIRVRMSDKIARINNLSKGFPSEPGDIGRNLSHQTVVNESLADTWLDLAGYAILEYVRITKGV